MCLMIALCAFLKVYMTSCLQMSGDLLCMSYSHRLHDCTGAGDCPDKVADKLPSALAADTPTHYRRTLDSKFIAITLMWCTCLA